MPSSPSCGSSSFFRTELERALSEQKFGILGYSMGPASAYDASATVGLLERSEITITLTFQGYQLTGGNPSNASNADEVFETLEALLQHYSPLYNAKRADLLIAKLSA